VDINRTSSNGSNLMFCQEYTWFGHFFTLPIFVIVYVCMCSHTNLLPLTPHHPWYHSHSVVRHNKLSEFYLAWRRVFYAGCLNIRVRTISKCATQQKSGRVSLFRCNRNTCYCSSTHPCYPLTSRLAFPPCWSILYSLVKLHQDKHLI